MDTLARLIESITLRDVILGVSLFVITFVVSLAIISFVLVKIPENYFKRDHPRKLWAGHHPGVRLAGLIGKNILGALLVLLGIVLSIPGVPGQGLLTILLGIMLLDFPGKRGLEVKIVSRPSVVKTINSLRSRFGKPKLVLD